LLAGFYEGDFVRLSLNDDQGASLGGLVVDGRGTFLAETPGGRKKLRDVILKYTTYRSSRNARVYLQPRRWFIVRLSFNVDAGVYHLGKARKELAAEGPMVSEASALLDRVALSRVKLDELHRIYGDAFRDTLNEAKLASEFHAAANGLDADLADLTDAVGAMAGAPMASRSGWHLRPSISSAPGLTG